MNILILINDAPNYINFLKKLGDRLKFHNHCVYYACESHLPEVKYLTSLENESTYYFTEFELADEEYSADLYQPVQRNFYYSCYDRNLHFGNNLDKAKSADRILIRLAHFFDHIINDKDIDLVLYENVSNSFAFAAYSTANKNNRRYFGLIGSRIPGRFEIWEDPYGNIEERNALFNAISNDITEEYDRLIEEIISSITERRATPDYMKGNLTNWRVNYLSYYTKKLGLIWRYAKYYRMYPKDAEEAYQSNRPLRASSRFVLRNLKRKIKIKRINYMFNNHVEPSTDRYFVVPLHFQPESSTSVNAMYYDNQYEFIKNTVFSLPVGYNLYVKDHPNGIGYLSLEFYKKIKKLPNVIFVHPEFDTKSLIEHSCGVITLTSTMGFEALLMEKPVLTLGKVFYNYHPYCYQAKSYHDIQPAIINMLNNKHENFHEINKRFLLVYLMDTYKGKVFNLDSDITEVYESIVNRYNDINLREQI